MTDERKFLIEQGFKLDLATVVHTNHLEELLKKYKDKQLLLNPSSLTLPTDEDMFFELNKILDSDFEANEKLAKREFGLGFKRSYRWLKNKVK